MIYEFIFNYTQRNPYSMIKISNSDDNCRINLLLKKIQFDYDSANLKMIQKLLKKSVTIRIFPKIKLN